MPGIDWVFDQATSLPEEHGDRRTHHGLQWQVRCLVGNTEAMKQIRPESCVDSRQPKPIRPLASPLESARMARRCWCAKRWKNKRKISIDTADFVRYAWFLFESRQASAGECRRAQADGTQSKREYVGGSDRIGRLIRTTRRKKRPKMRMAFL